MSAVVDSELASPPDYSGQMRDPAFIEPLRAQMHSVAIAVTSASRCLCCAILLTIARCHQGATATHLIRHPGAPAVPVEKKTVNWV